jgi:hypothetical protein
LGILKPKGKSNKNKKPTTQKIHQNLHKLWKKNLPVCTPHLKCTLHEADWQREVCTFPKFVPTTIQVMGLIPASWIPTVQRSNILRSRHLFQGFFFHFSILSIVLASESRFHNKN